MTISLSGLTSAAQQQSLKTANAKLQAAIANIVSGNKLTQASQDVAALSTASQLQAQTSGLKQISSNLAQASSMTQVADGGLEQIHNLLGQLQSLAQQAQSPILNAENRKELNLQFQQLSSQLNSIANSTTFNGQHLLDGSLSGTHALSLDTLLAAETSDNANVVSVPRMSADSLFGGRGLEVTTPEGAAAAFSVIGEALDSVVSTRAGVGSFQQTLDFASANIDSAITNQEAATSILQDTDFATASTEASLADVQQKAGVALVAQGNRLTPSLLKLVG